MEDLLEEFVIDIIKSTGVGLWIAAVITYKTPILKPVFDILFYVV